MAAHSCNSNIWSGSEGGGLEVQGKPQLQGEREANLDYKTAYLKEEKKIKGPEPDLWLGKHRLRVRYVGQGGLFWIEAYGGVFAGV